MSMLVQNKCAHCNCTDSHLKVCSSCVLVSYCSRACQKLDWKRGHKALCSKNTGEVRMIVQDEWVGQPYSDDAQEFLRDHYLDPNLVPTCVFGNMSQEDNTAAAASFAASTKKLRKKQAKSGPETAYQVWKRAMTTSAVVGMEFCANSPLLAKKAIVDFFKIYEVFKGIPSTKKQRDAWNVESYLTAMEFNSYQIDQQLLKAENDAWRARLADMQPSPEKTHQVYSFLENIELEEQTYVKLGQEFLDANIKMLVQVCFQAVFQLMELGHDSNGADNDKILLLVEKQYDCASHMLAACKVQYPDRAEHLNQLKRIKFILFFHTIKQPYTWVLNIWGVTGYSAQSVILIGWRVPHTYTHTHTCHISYTLEVREKRRNVVYWNPNGRSSMISCAIKSFKRHSQGMSLFMVCVFVF